MMDVVQMSIIMVMVQDALQVGAVQHDGRGSSALSQTYSKDTTLQALLVDVTSRYLPEDR